MGEKAVQRLAGTIFKNAHVICVYHIHMCIYMPTQTYEHTHIFMHTYLNETENNCTLKGKNMHVCCQPLLCLYQPAGACKLGPVYTKWRDPCGTAGR